MPYSNIIKNKLKYDFYKYFFEGKIKIFILKEMMKEQFSPEVLIYVQSVMDYLRNDSEAKSYFIINGYEDFFFNHLKEISQKNYDDSGEPNLTQMQFEILRKTIVLISLSKSEIKDGVDNRIYENLGPYGLFCLN